MFSAFVAMLAMAWAGWPAPVERTHAVYITFEGKPLLANADGSPKAIEVWGLESPVFVDAQTVPTPDKPLRFRASMDAADAFDRLVDARKPFDAEFCIYAEGTGRKLVRVVKLTGATILQRVRVAPGHGREGGLANAPYVGLSVICKTVKAGPPKS